jgi:hypothetical protein
MPSGTNTWRVLLITSCLTLPLSLVRADTNTPASDTITAPTVSDADRFFTQYSKATQLVRQNGQREASVVMDLLWRNLASSPWFEIALLKHAELNEISNAQVALEDYDVLRKRVENAPYFQGTSDRAAVFRAALLGSAMRGTDRIRIQRIRDALGAYNIRYHQYPESLSKLAVFNYIDMEDIHNSEGRLFHYTPTGQQFTPAISYHMYAIEPLAPEPFFVTSPKLEGTTQLDDQTKKYAALIRVPDHMDPHRVFEDQTLEGYFVAAVAAGGAVVCTPERVLVLVVPE